MEPFSITGSLMQGNLEGSPLFCLLAAAVRDAVVADPRLDHLGSRLRHWQFVDDWVFQCPQVDAALVFQVISDHLAAFALPLQPGKCAIHVPSLRGVPLSAWPAALSEILRQVSASPDDLPLLGTAAAAEFAAPLHVGSSAPTQLVDRAAAAVAFCRRLLEQVAAAPPAGAKQAAFALARCVAAHALDFDAAVLPCGLVLPYAAEVDSAVMQVCAATIDLPPDQLTEAQRVQLYLPRRLAGMQVNQAVTTTPLARTASLLAVGPALRSAIAAWIAVDPPADGVDFDAIDAIPAEVTTLAPALRALGIQALDTTGRPLPDGDLQEDSFRPARPQRHLLSAYLGHCAEQTFWSLHAAASPDDQVRLLSAGGLSAGTSLTAPLSYDGVHYDDTQWTRIVRWRLGFLRQGPPGICRNQRCDGTECKVPLTAADDHAVECPVGPLRTRRHNDVAEEYASILEEVGGIARREIYVPELSHETEAILDVWGYGIPELQDLLLDVTVHHPRVANFRPGADRCPGFAALVAEGQKHIRYPAAGGRRIWPVAYETWGRAGEEAEQLLVALAAAARRRAHRRGRLVRSELARWRARIDGVLHRGIALQLHAAAAGLPGKRPWPRRPADLRVLEASTVV